MSPAPATIFKIPRFPTTGTGRAREALRAAEGSWYAPAWSSRRVPV